MRKENKETGETLRKVKEEFQEKLAKTKNDDVCESPILGKITAHRKL